LAVGLTLEGIRFRLRPVVADDASFILRLRNDPQNARFLPPLTGTLEDQRNWIQKQHQLVGDYYFVVEDLRTGDPVGLTGLYAHAPDSDGGVIEWGRFVVADKSLAAPETSLLSHRYAFEILKVREVFGYSIEQNEKVIGFHRSCGLDDRGLGSTTYKIGDQVHRSLCFALKRDQWPEFEAKLTRTAQQISQILGRKQ
jgi:RimJ/RimL family protein N-acetyltransferase